MLGGSTGINLFAWDRASKAEYDPWQLFASDSDWNFDNLLPYFLKSETINMKNSDKFLYPSSNSFGTKGKGSKVVDGSNGPIHVSRIGRTRATFYVLIVFNRLLTTTSMGIWFNLWLQRSIISKLQQTSTLCVSSSSLRVCPLKTVYRLEATPQVYGMNGQQW
jgi:choline dehydrogenase-like flavoprotein